MAGQPLEVHVFPAASSESVLYEDDGESMAYAKGEVMRRRFRQSRTEASVTVEVAAPEGPYRPAARSLALWVRWDGEPRRVSSGTTALTRYTPEQFTGQATGWSMSDNGFVIVKQQDSFGAMTVTIER
jgi:hypothetical protein